MREDTAAEAQAFNREVERLALLESHWDQVQSAEMEAAAASSEARAEVVEGRAVVSGTVVNRVAHTLHRTAADRGHSCITQREDLRLQLEEMNGVVSKLTGEIALRSTQLDQASVLAHPASSDAASNPQPHSTNPGDNTQRFRSNPDKTPDCELVLKEQRITTVALATLLLRHSRLRREADSLATTLATRQRAHLDLTAAAESARLAARDERLAGCVKKQGDCVCHDWIGLAEKAKVKEETRTRIRELEPEVGVLAGQVREESGVLSRLEQEKCRLSKLIEEMEKDVVRRKYDLQEIEDKTALDWRKQSVSNPSDSVRVATRLARSDSE